MKDCQSYSDIGCSSAAAWFGGWHEGCNEFPRFHGGTIERITYRLSPRVARVVALPAPTEREKTQLAT